ncbi:MAG: flagellar export chaperone FlgN [Thermodesulfobacteriota bacterium]
MANYNTDIKKFIYDKKELYLRMLDLLEQERSVLGRSDLDALWQMNDVKNKISKDIEKLRQNIIECLDNAGVTHSLDPDDFRIDDLPDLMTDEEEKKLCSELCVDLKVIKTKVYNTQAVNRQFVEEYLGMLEELVTVIAETGSEKSYSRGNSYSQKSGGLILNQEA